MYVCMYGILQLVMMNARFMKGMRRMICLSRRSSPGESSSVEIVDVSPPISAGWCDEGDVGGTASAWDTYTMSPLADCGYTS